jgi:hypothetical protein
MGFVRWAVSAFAVSLAVAGSLPSGAAASESFPVGYAVDVDESGVSTGTLGGSGSLVATGSYGRGAECAPSSDGGPFSIGHYPPLDCAEVGRGYASTGSPEQPSEFLYTGNEHCVGAGRPLSGSDFYWHVQLPHTGYWHVAAYIPEWTQYGAGDIYTLTSADGQSQSGSVWQQGFHGQWVGLFGDRRFTAGQDYTVELPLADAEDPYCHYQMADQMEWVYDGPSSPSAAITSPQDNGTYPLGATVDTAYECAPALDEALESCTDSHGGSAGTGTLDTSELGTGTYIVTAKGVGGATATAQIEYTVVPTKIVCSAISGKITLRPGLTSSPARQAARLKGKLTGCSGGGFTEATYSATTTTMNPVGCQLFSSDEGEQALGTLKIAWKPKAKGGTSLGSVQVVLGEGAAEPLGGTIEGGAFAPATIESAITETFTGAGQCGTATKKRVVPVKKATLTGTRVVVY